MSFLGNVRITPEVLVPRICQSQVSKNVIVSKLFLTTAIVVDIVVIII